jgi:predicted PurR-regulated permease PerM
MNNNQGQKGRVFFFGLFALLAIAVLYIISPYLGVIAISLVTVTLLKPLFDWFMRHRWINGRSRIATTVTLITFFLIIVVPIYIIGSILIDQANEFLDQIQSEEVEYSLENLTATINDFISQIPILQDVVVTVEEVTETLVSLAVSVTSWLVSQVSGLGASLANLFIGGIIFLVVVASLLPTLDGLAERVRQISPLGVDITQIYLSKSREMTVSVVKGVFLLVILQGLIMGFFYWLADIPFTMFWTLLSMAFGILPVVGISFVVWFLAIIAIITGNTTSAVIILFGFYVVVNPLDLLLRPRLVSKEAYLNFALMLLALFGGLAVGGLMGMIYGPVFMILFITTIDIYAKYFSNNPELTDSQALESSGLEALPEPALAEDEESE